MSSVSTTQILQKQQSKMPSSMRYERIQEILERDPALGPMLGPKNEPVESRFGEKVYFSKEVVAVTRAIHAEGKDAHKLQKHEVLRVAMVVMKFAHGNGEMRAALNPPTSIVAPAAEIPAAVSLKKKTPARSKPPEPVAPVKPLAKPVTQTSKPKVKAPENAESEKSSKLTKATKSAKGAPEKESEPAGKAGLTSTAEEDIPESELPPEKQPLRLPPGYDTTKWPHYDVQSSIYSLLLSALNLSEHYEKLPDREERIRALEQVLKMYLATCDAVKKIGT